jgi:hypothetical protein
MGEIWRFRGEPAGRWGRGRGGTAIGSVDCENRATRRLQMDVSTDNGYGATEAGGWVDGEGEFIEKRLNHKGHGEAGDLGRSRGAQRGEARVVNIGRLWVVNIGRLWVVNIERLWVVNIERSCLVSIVRSMTGGGSPNVPQGRPASQRGPGEACGTGREGSHAEHGNQGEQKNLYLSGGLVPKSGFFGCNGYKGEKWLKNAEKGAKNGQKDAKTGVLRRFLVKRCNRSIH